MIPKKVNIRRGPEAVIQEKIVLKLRSLEWLVKTTHGNLYQAGLPDIYAVHKILGARWIEVKDPNRKGNIFTAAQWEFFNQLGAYNIGVWVLTSDSDDELAKLSLPYNWWKYARRI